MGSSAMLADATNVCGAPRSWPFRVIVNDRIRCSFAPFYRLTGPSVGSDGQGVTGRIEELRRERAQAARDDALERTDEVYRKRPRASRQTGAPRSSGVDRGLLLVFRVRVDMVNRRLMALARRVLPAIEGAGEGLALPVPPFLRQQFLIWLTRRSRHGGLIHRALSS